MRAQPSGSCKMCARSTCDVVPIKVLVNSSPSTSDERAISPRLGGLPLTLLTDNCHRLRHSSVLSCTIIVITVTNIAFRHLYTDYCLIYSEFNLIISYFACILVAKFDAPPKFLIIIIMLSSFINIR